MKILEILIILIIGYISGAVIHTQIHYKPKIAKYEQQLWQSYNIIDYYTSLLNKSLYSCDDIMFDNISLRVKNNGLIVKNAKLIEKCRK